MEIQTGKATDWVADTAGGTPSSVDPDERLSSPCVIATYHDTVYIGGNFSAINGEPAGGFAELKP